MKQHITLEQLKEVDVKKLLEYFSLGNKTGFSVTEERHGKEIALEVLSEGVTIGKMIEILNDFPNNYITSIRPKFKKENNKSYVELGIKDLMAEEECIDSWYLKGFHSEELADVLWKAIKEIL